MNQTTAPLVIANHPNNYASAVNNGAAALATTEGHHADCVFCLLSRDLSGL
jgi:hypothetical protein